MTTTFFHDDDVHPEVSDALLDFVYDASATNAGGLDDLLNFPSRNAAYTTGAVEDEFPNGEQQHCDKKLRAACGQQKQPQALPESSSRAAAEVVPPQPRAFVRGGADEKKPPGGGGGQSLAAKARRKRISQKTAELSRLIPGGHRLSTANMLTEAARHVKLLQAQVGMLALMRSSPAAGGCSSSSSAQNEEQTAPVVTTAALEEMQHALLASGRVQERLAAEGKCLVPTNLVHALARDEAVTSDPLLNPDLGRFVASLPPERK